MNDLQRMFSRESENSFGLESGYPEFEPLCRQWGLRLLIDLGGHAKVVNDSCVSEPQLLRFLGVTMPEDTSNYDPRSVIAALREQHLQMNGKLIEWPEQSHLLKNIRWLQSQLGLSELETGILLLCVLERHHIHLSQAMEAMGSCSNLRLFSAISVLLGVPIERVAKALASEGLLARTVLLRVDTTGAYLFRGKMELLFGLDEQLLVDQEKPFNIFADNFVVAPPASLAPERFAHLQPKFDHLKNYLSHEIKQGTPGVNILLYGPPGTGKTEFARTLSKSVGASLFEIAVVHRYGQRIEGLDRMSAFVLSQKILARRDNSLIVFDEIEDIDALSEVDEDLSVKARTRCSGRKGWFNRLLETNTVPAIWISNNIRHIDRAHLRRFNYHLHIDTPPTAVRALMLAEHSGALGVSEAWCQRMATTNRLEPALMARAVNVVGAMRQAGVEAGSESLLEEVITASLSAQSLRHSIKTDSLGALEYRLEATNASSDLAALVDGLRAHPQARLCLYGPPGTGKSAFAQHLAKQLGMAARVQRASDILGPYVGETEHKIAEMFQRATRDKAVIILDEADTFLMSRETAHHRWEISSVNELLTQMEAFEGVFFATTNLIEALDAASMRRFDAKIRFDYLKRPQIELLLREACEVLKIDPGECAVIAMRLHKLTPGDFSTVIRQARFSTIANLEALGNRLADEVRHKRVGNVRPIGFSADMAA